MSCPSKVSKISGSTNLMLSVIVCTGSTFYKKILTIYVLDDKAFAELCDCSKLKLVVQIFNNTCIVNYYSYNLRTNWAIQ